MQRVAKANYILIKANATGENDTCNFALIQLTDSLKQLVKERLAKIDLFKDDEHFFYLSYWAQPMGFYKDPENDEGWSQRLLGKDYWCYMAIEKSELETLLTPENIEGICQMHLFKDGKMCYKCYSKNEQDEFLTDDLPLHEILE